MIARHRRRSTAGHVRTRAIAATCAVLVTLKVFLAVGAIVAWSADPVRALLADMVICQADPLAPAPQPGEDGPSGPIKCPLCLAAMATIAAPTPTATATVVVRVTIVAEVAELREAAVLIFPILDRTGSPRGPPIV